MEKKNPESGSATTFIGFFPGHDPHQVQNVFENACKQSNQTKHNLLGRENNNIIVTACIWRDLDAWTDGCMDDGS